MTSADTRMRDATYADLAIVCSIYNQVLENSTATFEESLTTANDWEELYEAKQKNGLPFIVAESQGQVLGYGTYGAFRRASGYKISVEHSLHVREDSRGRGVGKALLRELIRRAQQAGVENMIAAIDGDNEASIQLHTALGFRVVGKLENIARKFGRDLTLIFMQLRIEKSDR